MVRTEQYQQVTKSRSYSIHIFFCAHPRRHQKTTRVDQRMLSTTLATMAAHTTTAYNNNNNNNQPGMINHVFEYQSEQNGCVGSNFKECQSRKNVHVIILPDCPIEMVDLLPSIFMRHGRDIMRSPSTLFWSKARLTHRQMFRAIFGTDPRIVAEVWNRIQPWTTISSSAKPFHLLWALLFMKSYTVEAVCVSMCGVFEKKFRKWE
jgi:hypothetical protein